MTKSKKLKVKGIEEYFPNNSGKCKSKKDMIKERKKFEKEMEKEDKELLAKSKPYEELIKPISGIIKSLYLNNQITSHTPISEMVMGGISPGYNTGYQSNLEIIIESEDNPVKKLLFMGNCYIHEGDKIKAYILAEEKKELNSSSSYYPYNKNKVSIPRELKEKETALYIEKIKNWKVIETYYSVDYKLTK